MMPKFNECDIMTKFSNILQKRFYMLLFALTIFILLLFLPFKAKFSILKIIMRFNKARC